MTATRRLGSMQPSSGAITGRHRLDYRAAAKRRSGRVLPRRLEIFVSVTRGRSVSTTSMSAPTLSTMADITTNNLAAYYATWYHKFGKSRWHMGWETWYQYMSHTPNVL